MMADSRGKNLSIIGVLGMFSFLTSLSGSSTNLAIPKIAISMNISSSAATWIVQIGLITTAILLVMFGHIGDILSKNAVFLAGGIAFLIGSTITGFAPDFITILIGRVIQAIGAAMIMANSMGIVTQYFPDNKRAEALAMISMFISVGSISGPGIGGFIISVSSWRWIYWINIPLGILVLWLGFKFLPIPKESWAHIKEVTKGANWTGQNLFTIGIILFFLSGSFFQSGRDHLLMGLAFFIVGGAITVYSFIQDDKSNLPWIAPEVLRNKGFMTSIFALSLVMLVNAISNILLPFYLQSYNGMSPFASGLVIMLQSVMMLITTPFAGVLADKINRELMTVIGLAILMFSQVGYAFFPDHLDMMKIIPPIVLNGMGIAIFLSPNNALTMGMVDKKLSGIAGSFNSFARTLGMTIGISFASSALFFQLPGVTRITPAVGDKFVQAFYNVFWIATAISGLALAVVLIRYLKSRKEPVKKDSAKESA
ncbi:MFS transporter [Lentilactobacillus hilgardii]|jgi:EmrB/QacA subfamily drug resistance transporter|uniref:MFS transporter n=2 Tax=Lentilactobacillus hilgardii TaxID=1588 RepID=A0A6P1E996_LENHI|nr:transporter, major facilitator family protein [Lentilactobacillus hilgardii ATCC 27305]MCT3392397.1 MFS transporter [Lentilactobacillus hilgardii]QHB51303.1 MFS transporter [Lentilactobacillus hilgardii]RRG12220.1 MAG: MFS transporter [Lactobacillus sp.]